MCHIIYYLHCHALIARPYIQSTGIDPSYDYDITIY